MALIAPSSAEMAAFDQITITNGASGSELMERAGRAMYELIYNRYLAHSSAKPSAVVLCGAGNNGGDGFVVARHLRSSGVILHVVCLHSDRYSKENLEQAQLFLQQGGELLVAGGAGGYGKEASIRQLREGELESLLQKAALVVDAIFGTGQKSAAKGISAKVLAAAANHKAGQIYIALDVPSGIDASSGAVFEPHFSADLTVTVETAKRGMLQYPARECSGEISSVKIGIECGSETEFMLQDISLFASLLQRAPSAHKGNFGRVLVVGGSARYQGAPVLAAHAAVRSGAGLVTIAEGVSSSRVAVLPEVIHLPTRPGNCFSTAQAKAVVSELELSDALVLGPGLGDTKKTRDFLRLVLKAALKCKIPTVLDADGLNLLCDMKKDFLGKLYKFVLTPHPGEMARLLGSNTKEIQEDRFSAVKRLADSFNCTAVLKGAGTLIFSGKLGRINQSGNSYMASGGSGDVLGGVIAAMLARGINPFDAASIACHVHGLSADLVVTERIAPVSASDVIENLPRAFDTVQRLR